MNVNLNLCTEIPGEVFHYPPKDKFGFDGNGELAPLPRPDRVDEMWPHTRVRAGWEVLTSFSASRFQPPCRPPTDVSPLQWFFIYVSETAGCYTEVWGTEKLTGKQTSRGTMNEQMFKTVRKKEKGRSREHTYPVRLDQKRKGRRGEGWGEGWVGEGQKRQDEERDRSLDQTRAAEI